MQGLGAVGSAIVRRLIASGATVTACDPDPAAARRGAALGARIVPPGRIGSLAADLFVPAAVGGTVDERFAARCRVRVVCGPANNALSSPGVEGLLRRRGIVFVPDVLASAGALIAGLSPRLRGAGEPGPAVDRIGPRVGRILREAERGGLDASEVARRAAARRLRRGR